MKYVLCLLMAMLICETAHLGAADADDSDTQLLKGSISFTPYP